MADALALADQMLPAGRGSILRGGRSCIGLGSVVDASLAAAGSNTFTITIDEDCVLDRLFISTSGVAGTNAILDDLVVTDIKVGGDALVSSNPIPATMFAKDAVNSPKFGNPVSSDSKVSVTITNNGSAAALNVTVGFSAA